MSEHGMVPPLPTSPDSLRACRGVVRLFNAVAKAQRAQREAAGGGARGRAARLSTSGFLAELRRAAPGAPVRPCNQKLHNLNLYLKHFPSVESQALLARQSHCRECAPPACPPLHPCNL